MTEINLLTALKVKNAGPGMHRDGRGLYLQVSGSSAKSWIYRFTLSGKTRDLGLGSAVDIPLVRARELAAEARQLKAEGKDPIEHRKAQRAATKVAEAKPSLTFRQCAERYIAIHEPTWKNSKHRQQWKNTLETYAYPIVGDLLVRDVDTALVMKVIEPIWMTKNETAVRLRGRIETILDFATPDYREGENPARLRLFKGKLPARKQVRKLRPARHHPALSYAEVAGFMVDLRTRDSISARCLEFLILTAVRTSDALDATRTEINLEARAWTIPGKRMKAGKDHRVPLCARACEILRAVLAEHDGPYVFSRDGKPLSNNALIKMVRVMNANRARNDLPLYVDPHQGNNEVVPHGFRSTFRDWAAEVSNFPREQAEVALAHTVGDDTEVAYQRGDLFEKRRRLMDAWAAYCAKPSAIGNVVRLGAR